MPDLALYTSCIILGGAGAWLISRWGGSIGLLDSPNERSSHDGFIPKGGGIGILAAFVLSSLVLKIPVGFWLSVSFLALISFYGDKSELPPKFRLPVQFIVALFLVQPLTLNSQFSVLWLTFLTVFIVGTANFYNFMDGINGIAGITGVVAFGLLALSASFSGINSAFVTMAICMSFSCLGFLPFNIPKAKVFMGDVGSILLGFVFAGMVVYLSKSFLDFICLAALLFPFYADELTTMYVRFRKGENLIQPHRRHLYQILANDQGRPHWKVAVGYGLAQLIGGMIVLIIKPFGSIIVLSLLAVYFGAFIAVSSFVRKKVNICTQSKSIDG